MNRLRMFKAEEIINALQKAGFVPLRHQDGRLVTVSCHAGQDIGGFDSAQLP